MRLIDPPLAEGAPVMAIEPPTEEDPHELALWPHWEWWRGVKGHWYARRKKSSPPKVIRADSGEELVAQIRAAERRT